MDFDLIAGNSLCERKRKGNKQTADTFTFFYFTNCDSRRLFLFVLNELNEIIHLPVKRQDGQQCKTEYLLHSLKCVLQLYIRGEFQINVSDTAYFSRMELLKTRTKLKSSDGIEDGI